MPIPTANLYNPHRLHRWFAVSSLLMTASILWLIWADYDRPWRGYQYDYFSNRAGLAYLKRLQTLQPAFQAKVNAARQHLESVRQWQSETRGEDRAALESELAAARLEAVKAGAAWGYAAQRLEILRSNFEKLSATIGAAAASEHETHARYLAAERDVARLRGEKEKWDDEAARLSRALQDIDAPVVTAEKRLRDLQQQREAAEEQYRQYRGVLDDAGLWSDLPIVRWIVNFPLLDFTAPKNTPGRAQVNQLVLPDIKTDLQYVETYTTDRCTTCHVSIDDPAFTLPQLIADIQESIPVIDAARSAAGRPPLEWPAPPGDGEETLAQQPVASEVQRAYLDSLVNNVNTFLCDEGLPPLVLPRYALAHPNLELYVAPDSAHPMSTIGCTICHEGNGQATDFVLAAHSPGNRERAESWKRRHRVTRLGVPAHTLEEVVEDWSKPMVPMRYIESSCARCHDAVWDLPRFGRGGAGGTLVRGQYLFDSLGCANCHPSNGWTGRRRVGPDLRHIASKLRPEFVRQWILDPQRFRPNTRMPHFFDQENNRPAAADELDPDPRRRTFAEVYAITKYLFAVSDRADPAWTGSDAEGDPTWGREMVKSLGCLACHGNLDAYARQWITEDLVQRLGMGREAAAARFASMTYPDRARYVVDHFRSELDGMVGPDPMIRAGRSGRRDPVYTRFGPEFFGMGSKLRFPWIYSWLKDPKAWSATTKMPKLRLTDSEAAHVAAYLASLQYTPYDLEADADQARDAQGMVRELLFTLTEAQESTRRARELLDDAGGRLTEDLVDRLAPSMGADRAESTFADMPLSQRQVVLFGAKMITHYGCYACHLIRGFEHLAPPGTDLSHWAEKPIARLDFGHFAAGPEPVRMANPDAFRTLFPSDAEQLSARNRVKSAEVRISYSRAVFASQKLLNPRIWDRMRRRTPYEKLKMPNFYLAEKELDALVTYLLSRKSPDASPALRADPLKPQVRMIAEGRKIAAERNCVGCHEIDGNKPIIHQYLTYAQGGGEDFDQLNAPPSLRGVGAKVQTAWLYGFLDHATTVRDWLSIRMPSFGLTLEDRKALSRMFVGLCQEEAAWLAGRLAILREQGAWTPNAGPAASHNGQTAADAGAATVPGSGSNGDGDEKRSGEVSSSLQHAIEDLNDYALHQPVVSALPHGEGEQDTVAGPGPLAPEELWRRVDKVRRLYDVSFPTMDIPTSRRSQKRLEDGLTLFKALNCMACHWFSDPGMTGSRRRRLAPNFRPVYRRLRREWVHAYLEKPRRMLPYTYMPDLFGKDVSSPFLEWVPAEREALQARLHDPKIMNSGRAVIRAITDFLFDAGATYREGGDTAVDVNR